MARCFRAGVYGANQLSHSRTKYIVDELQMAGGGGRLLAVVIAGFGGTIMHVIVEEAGLVGADTALGRADVGGSGRGWWRG